MVMEGFKATLEAVNRTIAKFGLDLGEVKEDMASIKSGVIRMKAGVDRLWPPKPLQNQNQSPSTRDPSRPMYSPLNQVQQEGLGT